MEARQIVCHGCLSRVAAGMTKCPYCGHSFVNHNPAGTLPVGTLLMGRYTLDKCIALDGEGVSYAAVDGQMSRRVMIKEYVPVTICAARTRSGQVVPRPEREVLFKTTRMDFADLYRALIAVGPIEGLCRVYDLVEANNTAYAIQEQPGGTTLRAYLQTRRVPLTQAEAITLLRPVVYAVEAMHRKGLLHRGVSPDTIFITTDGRAKLSGFATQGLRTADSELRSQMFEGYSAPEQYAVAEFDGKYTDVYGLGAVFYRAMTGVTPPAADRRRVSDTLIAPRNVVDSIPTFTSAALCRALRLVSAERIQTAPDLLAAITAPMKQDKESMITPRQKKYMLIAGVGLVLITVLLVLVIVLSGKGENKPTESLSVSQSVSSEVISAQPVTVPVPSFVNQPYTNIQQNAEYMKNFLFVVNEEFSNVFNEGYVMDQTPSAGSNVEPGTMITLTVSRGPEMVLMPTVIGYARVDAKAALDTAGIDYIVLERTNDGSYTQDYVVDCDVAAGTAIDPTKTVVTLYVAQAPTTGAPPASSSSGQATA